MRSNLTDKQYNRFENYESAVGIADYAVGLMGQIFARASAKIAEKVDLWPHILLGERPRGMLAWGLGGDGWGRGHFYYIAFGTLGPIPS